MNKIVIILQREYLSRVKKKSFIIMTILGPILLAGLMIAPALVSNISDKKNEVAIVDESQLFGDKFQDTGKIGFTLLPVSLDEALSLMNSGKFDAVLHLPEVAFQSPSTIRLFSERPPISAPKFTSRMS